MDKYDENRTCPKCNAKANTRYDNKINQIIRTCILCGYVWREQPLDISNLKNENENGKQELLLEN